jgi:AcrR family transcriptional regulator
MTNSTPYHHGDLRTALIQAGETVLQETGVDRFSLRQVARLVGVSHSAPAHHFGDANGLLEAIAADGFRRLLHCMERDNSARGPDPTQALLGSGIGYVRFAKSAPATFGLMFGPAKVQAGGKDCDFSDDLQEAAEAAFEHLARNIETLTQRDRTQDERVMQDIFACWSMVHGFADLLICGSLRGAEDQSDEDHLEMLASILLRTLPAPSA